MKAPSDIDRIIRIHLTGHPTTGESEQLQQWLAESEEHVRQYRLLQKVWQERSVEPIGPTTTDARARAIWNQAQSGLASRSRRVRYYYWLKVAAVVVVVASLGVAAYLMQFLALPAGEASRSEVVARTSTPGEKLELELPDGSRVWLNAASSLRYRVADFDSVRSVELSGEAYFDVAKDPTRTFVVTSGALRTVALGTAFNVRAYHEQATCQVTLVEGTVRVEGPEGPSEVLKPGTALSYDQRSGEATTYKVSSVEGAVGWKNGLLVFDGDSFQEFILKTERWYGVAIETVGGVPDDWSLSGHYENVPLEQLLDDVSFGKEFSYKILDHHVSLIL